MTPTAEQLTEAISGAVAIAPQLKTDARWLWMEAYWPAGRNPDRPTRLGPRRDPRDPDHVPGERLALGVGNDGARAAFDRAAVLVVDAHRLAGHALAHYSGRRPPVGTRRPARGDEFATWTDATVRRLRQLLNLATRPGAPDEPRRDAHASAVALVAAHAALQAVMRDVDRSGELPPQKRCKTCQNAAAEGRTECWRCINYRMRNKGRTRPVPRNLGAFAARDRRRERGEDYGENPPPRGRYIDGQWTEAS